MSTKTPLTITAIALLLTCTTHAGSPSPKETKQPINEPFEVTENFNEKFDDWYYKKTDPYKGWKYLVIHHSATSAGSVKSFHKFHTQQGYGGIAYHYVIGNGKGMKDGEVQETFRWKDQIAGTHSTVNSWKYNIFGIGICLVGNLEKKAPTAKQLKALKALTAKLSKKHHIPASQIIGHQQVPFDKNPKRHEQTACPGKKLNIHELRKAVSAFSANAT